MSIFLTKILILEYTVIMIVCLIEQKYIFALYWLGAIILNWAVMMGLK